MAYPVTVNMGIASGSYIFLEEWEVPIARGLRWNLQLYKGDYYRLCSDDEDLDRCMQAFHREKFRFAIRKSDFAGVWVVVGPQTDLADAVLDKVLIEQGIRGEDRYSLSYESATIIAKLATMRIHQAHGPYGGCDFAEELSTQ